MNMNKWTMGLAAAGVVTLSSVAQAQDAAAGATALAASTTLSGYVSTGYHFGNGQEPGGENYFRAADTQNAFSLDVVDLKLSSAQGDGAMATGYTVELWMGPAASDIGTQDSGTGGTVELMQANIDLRLDVGTGLDLKVGQFGTIVGNDVYNYNENTFYTHSWGFAMEPTHHTGILGSYTLTDGLTVGFGVANTTGNATNGSSGGDGGNKAWMASVSYTLPDSLGSYLGGSELYYGVIVGGNGAGATTGNGTDSEFHYASISTPLPIANLSHKITADHVEYGNAAQADSNVFGYHLSYALNDDTTINARGEIGNINSDLDGDGTRGSVDSFENADSLRSLTLGVDYKIWENVTSRIEYRHDSHKSDVAANQNSTTSRGSSQDTIALNLIYSF